MFLCWENRIGFCWRFAYFLVFFRHLSCGLPPAPGADKQPVILTFCSSLVGYLSMAHWHWPGLIGLASLVHCLIGSFSLASFALASLAHSLIGAHWLIGSLGSHWLIGSFAPFLAFFELFCSSFRTLGPQGYLTSSYLSWSLGSGW